MENRKKTTVAFEQAKGVIISSSSLIIAGLVGVLMLVFSPLLCPFVFLFSLNSEEEIFEVERGEDGGIISVYPNLNVVASILPKRKKKEDEGNE